MKNLLKSFTVIFLLSFGTDSLAQNFGLRAGLNLSRIRQIITWESYGDFQRMNPGFHIGPTVEFPTNDRFSFESGLLLSTKGRKMNVKQTIMDYEHKQKLNLFYLDIPLTAKATFDISSLKIYGTFGPYIGIGLFGKFKLKYTPYGEFYEENIKFGSNEDYKRFDYGLTAGGGIEFNTIQIGIIYSLGLANMSSYGSGKIYNRVLGISVGYGF